jgi:hypothetical protein
MHLSVNNFRKTKLFQLLLIILCFLGILISIFIYFNPLHIIQPSVAHHHIRLQIINEGNTINFADEKFQEPYKKDQCSGELSEKPIHVHDNKDQIVHIHWSGITGGELLKFYGLNEIGGFDDNLGYTLAGDGFIKTVPIQGKLINNSTNNSKIWIYTGDTNQFKKQDTKLFLKKDLEKFLGKKSKLTIQRENISFLGILGFADSGDNKQISDKELENIQDLIGNIVVFIQYDEPNSTEIQEKFKNLVELDKSVCGG